MIWNFKWLATLLCVTVIDSVLGIHEKSHKLHPVIAPERPVSFPFEVHCVTKNVWRYILEVDTRVCCCEAQAQCKKMRYQHTYLNCVTRSLEQMDKMTKCCEERGNTWERGHLTGWVQDC